MSMLGLFFVAGGRSGKWGASFDSLDAGMGCIGTYIVSGTWVKSRSDAMQTFTT